MTYGICLQFSDVQLFAVSHWGVHLAKLDNGGLQVIRSISLSEITSCIAPRPTTVNIEGAQGRISLHATRAQQLSEMVTKFCTENKKVSVKIRVFYFNFYVLILIKCFCRFYTNTASENYN